MAHDAPESSAEVAQTRRDARAQRGETARVEAATLTEDAATTPSRRGVIVALAVAGAASVAAAGGLLGSTLVPPRTREVAGSASSTTATRRPSPGVSATPTRTASPTPKPTRTSLPKPSAATMPPPVTIEAAPPAGAPRVPASQKPPVDRDASYVAADDRPTNPTEFRPAMPLRPDGPANDSPVPVPVADSPEAHAHVLRRAGIAVGAAAVAEIADVGLETWLGEQLDPGRIDDIEARLQEMFPLAFLDIAASRAALNDYNDQEGMRAVEQSTFTRRLFGSRQVFEQVVDVFANLLNVPPASDGNAWSIADYHRTVIRANALGRYADMLAGSARHPAMMTFLDNKASTGESVNENYGRELLELHTVGVGSGYGEDDVRSSAIIMSGRRVDMQTFSWEPRHHAIGAVRVLDFSDPNATAEGGLDLGDRYIDYLAHHPATATNVARKLAVRFVSDAPSDELIAKLTKVYLDTDTDIRAVMVAIFSSLEFWASRGTKMRRPTDDLCGVVRAMGMGIDRSDKVEIWHLFWALDSLGDAPLRWAPPNGYPDVAGAWLSGSQVAGRWDHHRELLYGHRRTYSPAASFVSAIAPPSGATVKTWADAVSRVVLSEAVDDRDLVAVTTLLGATPDAPVTEALAKRALDVAALLFDSSRYVLR